MPAVFISFKIYPDILHYKAAVGQGRNFRKVVT